VNDPVRDVTLGTDGELVRLMELAERERRDRSADVPGVLSAGDVTVPRYARSCG
jgi:hypothetical protein